MKSTFRNGLMLVAVLALAGAPSAWAACTLGSEPVLHGFGGLIDQCPEPATGYVYALASPTTINSGTQWTMFVCNEGAGTNGIGLDCGAAGGAGGPSDGAVTVLYDFGSGNPGSVGCPNPTQVGNGSGPVAVEVHCANGATALVTVGWSEGGLQYILEQAGPADFSPVHAGFGNGPTLTSVSAGPSPSAKNVCVNVPAPNVYSDCDPTALGSVENSGSEFSTCPNPAARQTFGRGNLYVREAACDSRPDPRVASGWVVLPTLPDAGGNACNTIADPTVPDNCMFVGATGRVAGAETGGVLSWLKVGGPQASNDKVKIDKAEFAQGKLVVNFSTTNESLTVGFNVYSDATKLNGSQIIAKGAGSNAYTFEVGRGALKGGKTVLVEAVKSDGTFEKSVPVALK